MIDRNEIGRSHRIIETEKLIVKVNPQSVLEIGSGDYSFDYLKSQLNGNVKWDKLDFDLPCDILMDINSEELQIPLENSSYDLIIMTEVLEHLLWPQSVLKECHRILTLNGAIIGSVPNIASLSYRIKWLFGGVPSCAAYAKIMAGHVIDFNKKNLKQLVFHCSFSKLIFYKSGLFWGRQILSTFLTPSGLGSNLLFVVEK